MNKTLIIGKNSFFSLYFKKIKNSKIISHNQIKNINPKKFSKIILLSMPFSYKKKISALKFEKKIFNIFKNKRIIYFSTSMVYPNKENNLENYTNPQNIYGKNKYQIEKLIKKSFKNHLIIRAPIVFMKDKHSKDNFFYLMNKNFKKNKVKFNMSENSIRDLITLKDIYYYYLKFDRINLIGTFNIGCKRGVSVRNILQLYYGDKINNKKLNFSFYNKNINLTLNIDKLEKKIGNVGNRIFTNVIKELKK